VKRLRLRAGGRQAYVGITSGQNHAGNGFPFVSDPANGVTSKPTT
jgi:hypothetical protein